jgi:hypothetical protein
MVDEATNPATLQRLAEETRRLRESVASISFAWANVENAMVMLLYAILRDDQGRFSSAIYFAPNAIETRFRIVDKAIIELADSTCCEKEIIASWSKVLSKLNALKQTRNRIAHGQISTMSSEGENHVRLTNPIYNIQEARRYRRRRQIPGLTSSDLETHLSLLYKAIEKIEAFRFIIDLVHAGDFAALKKRLAELTADLPSMVHPAPS